MLGAYVLAAGLAALAPGTSPGGFDPLDAPARPSALAARAPLLALSARDGVAVSAGLRGCVLRSEDGGRRWTAASVPVSADLTAIRLAPGGRGLAVGHDGVVLATEDAGRTWARRLDGRGIAALLRARYPGCGGDASGGGGFPAGRAGLGREVPEAIRIACEQGAGGSLLDVWVGEDGRGLAVGAFGLVLFTADGGRRWIPWLDRVDAARALHLYAVAAADGELLVAGEQGLVLRVDPARHRLVEVAVPAGGSLFGMVARGRDVVAFGLAGRVLRSGDAGATWRAVATGIADALVGGTVLPGGRIVLLSVRGALVASDDGGRTFRPLPGAAAAPAAAVAATDPAAVLVAGAAGVARIPVPQEPP